LVPQGRGVLWTWRKIGSGGRKNDVSIKPKKKVMAISGKSFLTTSHSKGGEGAICEEKNEWVGGWDNPSQTNFSSTR